MESAQPVLSSKYTGHCLSARGYSMTCAGPLETLRIFYLLETVNCRPLWRCLGLNFQSMALSVQAVSVCEGLYACGPQLRDS